MFISDNSMAVLNPINRPVFNQMILMSQQEVVQLLPSSVEVLLPDEYNPEQEVSVPMDVDEETRMDYVRTYVEELDLFGEDLYNHPIDKIFAPCVTEQEKQVLESHNRMDEEVQRTYQSIWQKAFGLTMSVIKEEIMEDAKTHFTHDLRDRAYESYYALSEPER